LQEQCCGQGKEHRSTLRLRQLARLRRKRLDRWVSEPETHDRALLRAIVHAYNAGVRSGDFSAYLAFFTADAVIEFEGIPDGPLVGMPAIAEHFTNDAPDDEIRIVRDRSEGDRIVAEFVWTDIPETRGGDLIVRFAGDRITYACIAFGGPARRWR
jgi:hypothetical protein